MPLPLLAAGGLSALLSQVIRYVFLAHLAGFVIRLFALLGLSLVTNEYLLEPVLNLINSNMGGLPGTLTAWMDAFGFDNVLSIFVSAYTLVGVKRVFLGKAA